MLVKEAVEEGRSVIDQLLQEGFAVTAAFWMKHAEDGLWRLYVVSPLAEAGAGRRPFARLHAIVRQLPDPHLLEPFAVRVLGPSERLAKAVLAVYRGQAGPQSRPIEWSGPPLGDVGGDEAYLYPLPELAVG